MFCGCLWVFGVWLVSYCLLDYLCLVFDVDLCFCELVLLVPVSFLGFGVGIVVWVLGLLLWV